MSTGSVTKGKAAFVSGAGRNIGRAIALELARRGCHVAINGASNRALCDEVAGEVEKLGGQALVVMGDVGDGATAQRLAHEALARFGTVDILVNNAAVRPGKAFLETTEAEWRRVLDVDLNASFHLCQAFLPGMIAKGWGRIVNITGMNAIMGHGGRVHVSVAKHGVWGLTKSLAKEFAPQGVLVNAISPGPIRADRDEWTTDNVRANGPRMPLGRMGYPAEIAAMCGVLCGEEGSYVTGQMIAVNGGGTM